MLAVNNTETKRPCEIVLIGNEKGGCGKTTTTLSLANCLTELGFKVCCVDLDPSGNLTCAALSEEPEKVLYDVFEGKAKLADTIVHTPFGDILPTAKTLTNIEDNDTFSSFMTANSKSLGQIADRMIGKTGAEKILNSLLRNYPGYVMTDHYDFILVDTGPSDNILVRNAIFAADSILIPCEQDSGALNGVAFFINSVRNIERTYETSIPIDGLLITNFSEDFGSQRATLNDIDFVCEHLNIRKYRTCIRNSANFPDALRNNKPIMDYLANGNGATDSMNLALEFLERRGIEPQKVYPGAAKNTEGHWEFSRIKRSKQSSEN